MTYAVLADQVEVVFVVAFFILILLQPPALFFLLAKFYKKCPPNRVMVIYGRTGPGKTSRLTHGGGAFVIPVVHEYDYLRLEPLLVDIRPPDDLSPEKIGFNSAASCSVAISTDPERLKSAATRLLGLGNDEICRLVEQLVVAQIREAVGELGDRADRETVLASVRPVLEAELSKLGLELIQLSLPLN